MTLATRRIADDAAGLTVHRCHYDPARAWSSFGGNEEQTEAA